MSQTGIHRYYPWRWTVLTWLAVVLWGFGAYAVNHPPWVTYTVDQSTREWVEETQYSSLSQMPFPVGWPLHYVEPPPAVPLAPVPAVGPLPPPAPSTVSVGAMVVNFLLIVVAIVALVYLMQRLLHQFSLKVLLILPVLYVAYLAAHRLIDTRFGYRASEWFGMAVYFAPVPVAVAVMRYGIPSIGWSRVSRKAPRTWSIDDFDNPDDAIATASKLDGMGDWDGALALYRLAAERWPERGDYIRNCVDRIAEKQSMTGP